MSLGIPNKTAAVGEMTKTVTGQQLCSDLFFQAGLAAVIISHHVCNLYSIFSANLLMHMCFAMLATEV